MVSRFLYGDVADKRHVRLDYKVKIKILWRERKSRHIMFIVILQSG